MMNWKSLRFLTAELEPVSPEEPFHVELLARAFASRPTYDLGYCHFRREQGQDPEDPSTWGPPNGAIDWTGYRRPCSDD